MVLFMMSKISIFLGGLIALSLPLLAPVTASAFDYNTETFSEIEGQRGLPVRGMSSSKVMAEFGEPDQKSGPVGNPPISRWDYPDFQVYFERAMVITTVAADDRLPNQLKEIQ